MDSFKKLMSLRSPTVMQQYTVLTSVLNCEISTQEDNPLYGYVLSFGSFASQEEAEREVRRLIEISGHRQFCVVPYATLLPLREREAHNTQVLVDAQGHLLRWEQEQARKDALEYERAMNLRKSIAAEAAQECDPSMLEYFKRQCYLALQHHGTYLDHSQQGTKEWDAYVMYREKIRAHIRDYPEHETQLLPYLKQTLLARGEEKLYLNLSQAYTHLRAELLGLQDDTEEKEFRYN